MSDVFEGPGWWMASDGRWYAPERHPDPDYRTRFDPPESESSAVHNGQSSIESPPSFAAARADSQPHDSTAREQARVASLTGNGAVDEPVAEQARVASLNGNGVVDEPVEAEVDEFEFRVNKAPDVELGERPTFAPNVPASVVSPRPTTSKVGSEIGLQNPFSNARPTYEPNLGTAPAAGTSAVTDIVFVEPEHPRLGVPVRDRITAALMFVAGVGVIVGSFLEWTTGIPSESGWERGEGIVTVVAGVVAAAAAGPMFVGLRHVVSQVAAIISGLASLVAVGIVVISVLDAEAEPGVVEMGVGSGLIVVGASAAAIILAAIASQSELT